MKKFSHESKILKRLDNENIIKLIGVSQTHEFFIILEYMSNGSLDNFLKSSKNDSIDFNQIINFAKQISNGMKYLEFSRIVHADLAARNILVGEKHVEGKFYQVKIADFELSHELGDHEQILIPFKNSCIMQTEFYSFI